jgi:hypothetical protein
MEVNEQFDKPSLPLVNQISNYCRSSFPDETNEAVNFGQADVAIYHLECPRHHHSDILDQRLSRVSFVLVFSVGAAFAKDT